MSMSNERGDSRSLPPCLPPPATTCHLPPAPHHLPAPATCHHTPPHTTTHHHTPPPATTHHLPPATTCHYLPPPATTCHLPPPATSCGHLPATASNCHLPPPAFTCRHLPPPATCRGHLPPPAATCHLPPQATIRHHLQAATTVQHFGEAVCRPHNCNGGMDIGVEAPQSPRRRGHRPTVQGWQLRLHPYPGHVTIQALCPIPSASGGGQAGGEGCFRVRRSRCERDGKAGQSCRRLRGGEGGRREGGALPL